MPYVPGFSYDLFISYGSKDNVDGWVEKFEKQLTGELTRLLGRPFSDKSIFFDRLRLHVGEDYPDSLDAASRESALMVILLSPSYLTSEWCSRERHAFPEQLAPGATFANSRAVCRIRPTGPLPDTLAYGQQADFVIPGREEPWPTASDQWTLKVNDLAVQIKYLLQNLRSRAGAVFLGPTLNRQISLRDDLADYLAKQHFRATPHPAVLLEDPAARQKALAEAVCAVHFLGESSDDALACIDESTKYCSGPTVLFQPFGIPLSAAEDFFLNSLPEDGNLHRPGPNEVELQKFLEDLLTQRRKPVAASAALGLVCEFADLAWAQKFQAPELSIDYPRFLQEKLSRTDELRRWRQLLKESHGLLFYHGQSPGRYLNALESLALQEKSQALRRRYLDAPDLDTKKQNRPADPVYPEGLNEFLDEVRRKVPNPAGGGK